MVEHEHYRLSRRLKIRLQFVKIVLRPRRNENDQIKNCPQSGGSGKWFNWNKLRSWQVWGMSGWNKSKIGNYFFFRRRYCVDSFDFDCQLNTLMRILCTSHSIKHRRTQLKNEIPLSQSSFSWAFFYCISSASTDFIMPANLIGSALYYTRRESIWLYKIADATHCAVDQWKSSVGRGKDSVIIS